MFKLINLFFGILERLTTYRYFNIFKTIYVNFRCLSFKQAIFFPIHIWGSVKLVSLMGRIIIKGPITTGMIQLGAMRHNEFVATHRSRLFLDGTLVFDGLCNLMNGYQISVQKNATLELGNQCYLGENVTIIASDAINIGYSCRIAYNSFIMDTDIHYTINCNTRHVYPNSNKITIGSCNWIGNGSRIMKGTVTPSWTIVTAGSFLNKNYLNSVPEYSILGGAPAKLIKEGQLRIFSLENEQMLNDYFSDPQNKTYNLQDNYDLLEFCSR